MAKRCWCSIDQALQCIVTFSIVTLLQRDTITIIFSIATLLVPCSCSRRHSWCCRAATAQKNSWQWKDDIILCVTSSSAFQKFQDVIVICIWHSSYVCCVKIKRNVQQLCFSICEFLSWVIVHCSCFIQKFKSALCIRSMLFDKCLKEYFQFPYFQLLLKKLKKRLTTMHALKLSRICLFAGMLYQTHATNARPSREGIIP